MLTTQNVPGASKNNPKTAAKAPRKKVTPALASTPADLSAAAMTDAGVNPGVPLSPARAAIHTALDLLAQVVAVVEPHLRVLPPGAGKNRGGRVPAAVVGQMPHMIELFRTRPDVAPGAALDAIDADRALAADLHQLAAQLTTFQSRVGDTDRLTVADAWGGLSLIYGGVLKRARKDGGLATLVAPLRTVLKRGPRTATTQVAASATQRKLDAAQRRAARAQHKADLAQQAADLAKHAETLAASRRSASAPASAPASASTPTPGSIR